MQRLAAHALSIAAATLLASGCGGSGRASTTDDPRVLTAHQTYAALGMVLEHTRSFELERGARVVDTRELAGFRCYHLLLLGDGDLGDVEMRVLDPRGREIGTRHATDGQAAMRVCTESAGPYEIVLLPVGASGGATLTTWSLPRSTCGTPIELVGTDAERLRGDHLRWVIDGSTAEAVSNLESGCAIGRAPEQIYLVRLAAPALLRAQTETTFDGALSLSTSCGDPQAVIACNDDAGDVRHSLVSKMVEPGDYFIVVDGYNDQSGDYRLTVDAIPEPQVRDDVCEQARDVELGERVDLGTTASDQLDGSCRLRGGPEHVLTIRVTERTRLRATVENSPDAVMYLTEGCAADANEAACVVGSTLSRVVDPGHYQLVVERASRGARLLVEGTTTEEPDISGSCGPSVHVEPLPLNSTVRGNTRGAGNRFTASCVESGSQDAVYHFRLEERMTVRLSLISLFDGVLHLRRGECTDAAAEIACNDDLIDNRHSMIIDELEPGDYFVIVDGFEDRSVGEYQLSLVASPRDRLPPERTW